jgi:2,3-bisphosphoglycerate-independent phosphoglycerate mutase
LKYIVVLGDGMPGQPVASLKGKTTLEAARHPHMDRLASQGEFGLVDIIPKGMPAGSDVGHLSVLGYSPKKYYTGRAPIEAASMNIPLGKNDVAFRCNFVTLAQKSGHTIMEDYSAGHIETKAAKKLITLLNKKLGTKVIKFFPGVSYRHIMVWRGGHLPQSSTPPHDISGRPVGSHLPKGKNIALIHDLMNQSREVLKNNSTKANAIWLWGEGKSTKLKSFPKKGGVISAVDIVRGVGVLAGLDIIKVPRVTGFLDTNYQGKVDYALRTLKKYDFVFIHIEAPDECGHLGDAKKKIRAIEDIDKKILGPLLKGLERLGPYRLLITSDHATPVRLKTHSYDPVVYLLYDSHDHGKKKRRFFEKEAKKSGTFIKNGTDLIHKLFSN